MGNSSTGPHSGFIPLSFWLESEVSRLSGEPEAPITVAVPSTVFDRILAEVRSERPPESRPREPVLELRFGLVTWVRA
jgi:hypothetical protein